MQKIKNFIDILAFIEANKDFSAYDFVVAYEVKSRAKSEISPVQFEKVCSEVSLIVSDSFSEPNIGELVQEILEKYNLSEWDDKESSEEISDDEDISEEISAKELVYKISKEVKLSKHEYDMFVSDLHNLRGIEWLDIVMEKCSPNICKAFKNFIKYSDED